ncbi:MAG TPA: hypothetical protein QF517_11065, partial [Pseudomonadales bacterium]|nr:hypothetical protein [Pseudomonadales bacterium]
VVVYDRDVDDITTDPSLCIDLPHLLAGYLPVQVGVTSAQYGTIWHFLLRDTSADSNRSRGVSNEHVKYRKPRYRYTTQDPP